MPRCSLLLHDESCGNNHQDSHRLSSHKLEVVFSFYIKKTGFIKQSIKTPSPIGIFGQNIFFFCKKCKKEQCKMQKKRRHSFILSKLHKIVCILYAKMQKRTRKRKQIIYAKKSRHSYLSKLQSKNIRIFFWFSNSIKTLFLWKISIGNFSNICLCFYIIANW